MLRDNDDVRKLLTLITSGLMTDRFSLDENDDEISPLINGATSEDIVIILVHDEKVLTINADHELFGRLVIAAKSRDINLEDVLS